MYKLTSSVKRNAEMLNVLIKKGIDVHICFSSTNMYKTAYKIIRIEEIKAINTYEVFTEGPLKDSPWKLNRHSQDHFRFKFYKGSIELSTNEVKLLIGKN